MFFKFNASYIVLRLRLSKEKDYSYIYDTPVIVSSYNNRWLIIIISYIKEGTN